MLQKAGFQQAPGKGSHTNWIHPLYSGKVTISGQARMRQSVARRDLPLSEAAMATMPNHIKKKKQNKLSKK